MSEPNEILEDETLLLIADDLHERITKLLPGLNKLSIERRVPAGMRRTLEQLKMDLLWLAKDLREAKSSAEKAT